MPLFVTRANISSITLSDPQPIQGGSYFSKIAMTGANPDEAIYIQTPKCITKDGVVKTEKRLYSDLLFKSSTEEHSEFMDLLRTIEARLKECIYARRELWFQTAMDADDIEYYFNSPIKPHKKDDYAVRVFIIQPKRMIQGGGASSSGGLVVYDDEQHDKTIDDVIGGKPVIGLLQLRGIKFTNSSLHLELLLSQTMIFKEIEEPKFLITQSGSVSGGGSGSGATAMAPSVSVVSGGSLKTERVATSQQSGMTEARVEATQPISAITTVPVTVPVPILKSAKPPTNEITEIDFSEEEVDESPVTLKNPKTVYTELYKTLMKRASRALRLYQKEIMDAEKFRRTHGIPKIDIADIIEEEDASGEYDTLEDMSAGDDETEYTDNGGYSDDGNYGGHGSDIDRHRNMVAVAYQQNRQNEQNQRNQRGVNFE